MKQLTLEQRRSRMNNLKTMAVANHSFGRRMYIHDYLPGHAVYDMEITCDDAAFNRLKALAETGVDVLCIPVQGYEIAVAKKFTELCHYFGLRVIFTVTNWEGAPGAQWRSEVMPQLIHTMEAGGFDGICADMRGCSNESTSAHDPELEDMLWQLYTQVKSRGGILVLCRTDNAEPPCIDKVCDYLLTEGVHPMLHTAGYVLPETADFAKALPFLQLPVLTEENSAQWAQYRKLYDPMVEENTLAYLDLKESDEIIGAVPETVHVSMFINDVKYLAVSNLSDKPFTLELKSEWTDRSTKVTASAFAVQPAEILLLKAVMEENV